MGTVSDDGGFNTKKWIILGVTAVVCIAAIVTGTVLLTRDVPMAQRDSKGLDASAAVKETDMITLVAGKRDFIAATPDEAAKQDKKSTADEAQVTYTKDTIPQVTGLSRLSEKADSLLIGWDEIDLYLKEYSPEFNACSPDLSAFKARGGKIMMSVGWEDQTVPPAPIIDYYERVCAHDGGIEAED